jgi:hypothetical protein
MSQARKSTRVLGASFLAALGLMAFYAASAQAVVGWLESGVLITENLPGHAVIHPLKATGIRHGELSVPAQNLKILCSELETLGGKLIANSSPPSALGTLHFKNCETFQKEKLNKGCKPAEPISAVVLGLLKLDEENKLTYILIEPDNGAAAFTKIDFNEETCALPDTEIKGDVAAECLNEKLETMEEAAGHPDFCLEEMVHHLIQEVSNHKLFPGQLLYGANEATIAGILDVLLATGNPFSGHV